MLSRATWRSLSHKTGGSFGVLNVLKRIFVFPPSPLRGEGWGEVTEAAMIGEGERTTGKVEVAAVQPARKMAKKIKKWIFGDVFMS